MVNIFFYNERWLHTNHTKHLFRERNMLNNEKKLCQEHLRLELRLAKQPTTISVWKMAMLKQRKKACQKHSRLELRIGVQKRYSEKGPDLISNSYEWSHTRINSVNPSFNQFKPFWWNIPESKKPIESFYIHYFHLSGRLLNRKEWLGSKGRHGWTKMDKFRFGGKHWGDFGYKSHLYGTHQPGPHSGWAWKGHVGSNK